VCVELFVTVIDCPLVRLKESMSTPPHQVGSVATVMTVRKYCTIVTVAWLASVRLPAAVEGAVAPPPVTHFRKPLVRHGTAESA